MATTDVMMEGPIRQWCSMNPEEPSLQRVQRLHELMDKISREALPLVETVLDGCGSWPPKPQSWKGYWTGVTLVDPPNKIWKIRKNLVMLDSEVAKLARVSLSELRSQLSTDDSEEVLVLTEIERLQVGALSGSRREASYSRSEYGLALRRVLKLLIPTARVSLGRVSAVPDWQDLLKKHETAFTNAGLKVYRWTLYRPGDVYDFPLLSLFPGGSFNTHAVLPSTDTEITLSISVNSPGGWI